MFSALKEMLLRKPDRQLDEVVAFIQDDFDVEVSSATIGRALNADGRSKKTIWRKAKKQEA
jgi:transposase